MAANLLFARLLTFWVQGLLAHAASWNADDHELGHVPPWAALIISATGALALIILVLVCNKSLTAGLPFFQSIASPGMLLAAASRYRVQGEALTKTAEARPASGEQRSGAAAQQFLAEMTERERELHVGVHAIQDPATQALLRPDTALDAANEIHTGLHRFEEQITGTVKTEVQSLVEKVQTSMTEESPEISLPSFLQPESASKLPPASLVLAAVVAPAELRMLKNEMKFSILFDFCLGFFIAGCVMADWEFGCLDSAVWNWVLVLGAVCFLQGLMCFVSLKKSVRALYALEDANAKVAAPHTGNPLWDAVVAYNADTDNFFLGLLLYQEILNSFGYSIHKFLALVSTAVGAAGVVYSIKDAVPNSSCDARIVMAFMHVYSFVYAVFLPLTVGRLLLWALRTFAADTILAKTVVTTAKSLDDVLPLKLPLFLTLVRAFVLQHSSDFAKLKAREHHDKIRGLRDRLDRSKERQAELKLKIVSLSNAVKGTQQAEATTSEEELIKTYRKGAKDALLLAAPLVAMVTGEAEKARSHLNDD